MKLFNGQAWIYNIFVFQKANAKDMSVTCESIHIPDSKVHGVNMGPIWGQQDPGGPHVGPMNFAIWDYINGWVQDCSNSSALAMELLQSCT